MLRAHFSAFHHGHDLRSSRSSGWPSCSAHQPPHRSLPLLSHQIAHLLLCVLTTVWRLRKPES